MFYSHVSNCLCSFSILILSFTLLFLLYFVRSCSTYGLFWQWKSANHRKRWPNCWMMQWIHTYPRRRACRWEWSTLRSWTLSSFWILSKCILLCVHQRCVPETYQRHWPSTYILLIYWGRCKSVSAIFVLNLNYKNMFWCSCLSLQLRVKLLLLSSNIVPHCWKLWTGWFQVYPKQFSCSPKSNSYLVSIILEKRIDFSKRTSKIALTPCRFRWYGCCPVYSSALSGAVPIVCWCSFADGTDLPAAG